MSWVELTSKKEAKELSGLPNFSPELFCEERRNLITGVMTQRLFFVTGRPGSGKTRALHEVVEKLCKQKENVTVLCLTGKRRFGCAKKRQTPR